jgi:flagellar assembly factor FliW
MKVRSDRFGEIELSGEAVVRFADGLLGFEDQTEFVLYEPEEDHPFAWLLSTTDPRVAFAVCDPELFLAETYELTLTDLDQACLELLDGDSVRIYVIVGPSEANARPTANLKGPVIINSRSRRAKQLLLYSARLPVRQPMQPERARWSASTAPRTIVRTVTRRAA